MKESRSIVYPLNRTRERLYTLRCTIPESHAESFDYAQDKLREASNSETLRFAQGGSSVVHISCILAEILFLESRE